VQTLAFETADGETLKKRFLPLFDDLLLTRLSEKDEKTIRVFSRYLAKVISRSTLDDPVAIEQALRPVISPVISREIAENKESMIDALYPIMGGMISKYVATAIKELIENINRNIEDGLSFEKLKRKVKSKITGISETELLLQKSSEALISSLFVIQKESGLLIAKAHLKDKELDDPYMIASMASAIKDFVNDWIQKHEDHAEVQLLSYGNATLYIESAGSVYLIAFLEKEPDYELRSKINGFFAHLVKNYRSFFQHFDGDDSSEEVLSLSKEMEIYLNGQKAVEKLESSGKEGKSPLKYLMGILAVIFLIYGYSVVDTYRLTHHLEQTIQKIYAQKVSIVCKGEQLLVTGSVDSIKSVRAVEDFLQKETEGKQVINRLSVSPLAIEEEMHAERTIMQKEIDGFKQQISEVKQMANRTEKEKNTAVKYLQKELENLRKSLHRAQLEASNKVMGLVKEREHIRQILHIQEEIASKLAKAFHSIPYYRPKELSFDFRKLYLFPENKAIFDPEAITVIHDLFVKYLSILVPYKIYIHSIVIEGHTDSSGSKEKNIRLSQERAEKVLRYLLSKKDIQAYSFSRQLSAEGVGSQEVVKVDGVEDKAASRGIKIKLIIKTDNILKQLQKTVK